MTPSQLRIWEDRYNWPRPVRTEHGKRLYSDKLLAEIREFVAAGKPFHQLDGGAWDRGIREEPAAPAGRPSFLDTYTDVDHKLRVALHVGAEGTVAHYLAGLGTMRPQIRSRYVDCVRLANYEMGGLYSGLIARYRIAEPKTQEVEA